MYVKYNILKNQISIMKRLVLFIAVTILVSLSSCSKKICPTYAENEKASKEINKC